MKKLDWILVGVLLAIAGLIVLSQNINKQNGVQVEITVDGECYKMLDLNEDQEVRIPSEGNHYNIIRIKNGVVDMIEADCKNQVCVKSAAISDIGENIVCLPHKVIVKIVGKQE